MGSIDVLSTSYSKYADIYSDSTANSLENKLNNGNLADSSDDELLSVCKDFEEYFMEQVVKSMVKMTKVPGEDDSDDNMYSSLFGMSGGNDSGNDSYLTTLSSYYGDQITTTLSKALCNDENGKGLGLAQTLYEQMKRNYGIDSKGDTK